METNERIVRGYIAPDILLRLLINKDDRESCVKMLQNAEAGKVKLITSLFALFEAVSSVESVEELDLGMLTYIMRVINISTEFEEDCKEGYAAFGSRRKEKLRAIALKREGETNGLEGV